MRQLILASTLALALVGCKKESKPEAGKAADPQAAVAPASGGAKADNSDPVKVVEQVFAAASSGKADVLAGLCDPAGSGDGDVKNVCGAKPGAPKWDEFTTYFSKGKVNGAPTIEGDRAAVKILFGPDGTKEETMNLTRLDGKWYLASF